jgi:rubrerythrin
MPSNYCNDDYYHGILRSKEGVYESYLTIAKVAREKGYLDIEQSFLNYANEYLKANEELQEQLNKKAQERAAIDTSSIVQQYYKLIVDGLDRYIKNEHESAIQKFKIAQALESCNCFEKDARLPLFIKNAELGWTNKNKTKTK